MSSCNARVAETGFVSQCSDHRRLKLPQFLREGIVTTQIVSFDEMAFHFISHVSANYGTMHQPLKTQSYDTEARKYVMRGMYVTSAARLSLESVKLLTNVKLHKRCNLGSA